MLCLLICRNACVVGSRMDAINIESADGQYGLQSSGRMKS